MSPGDGNDPVTDDEILFRRVSERSEWYEPQSDRPLAWVAFRPNRNDADGLSVWRAKYKSDAQCAAVGANPGQRYFVIALRAGRLREVGVHICPSPGLGGPGHASLVNLNHVEYERNKNAVRSLIEKIANELVEFVAGPFGPFGD